MALVDAERQRLSFGPSAGIYDRHRPDYPPAAIAWLLGAAPLRVLDVGAGTGKLTRALLAAGYEVAAVEPDPQMRDAFAEAATGAEVLDGSAEALPVPDGSFDAVAVGQAYHWFDASRALPEIARVLRPAGVLAVVWNRRDVSEPWVAELTRILVGPDGRRGDPETDRAIASFGPLFTPLEQTTVRARPAARPRGSAGPRLVPLLHPRAAAGRAHRHARRSRRARPPGRGADARRASPYAVPDDVCARSPAPARDARRRRYSVQRRGRCGAGQNGSVDRDRRRLSFGPSADVYERYRPGYPQAAIAWLLGPSPLRVLDVGAGTGKLTRALLAAGHEVVAVEPDQG